jgi:response regulator NasT
MPPLRIALADDESIIRMDLKEILQGAGHAVVGEASDGDAALALLEKEKPDVAILDIKMPGKTGLAVAKAASEKKLCAVILLTAYGEKALIEEAKGSGAFVYLVKPFKEPELLASVEMAVTRFQELKALAGEVTDLQDEIETRKLVDRAKGHLMDAYKMKEADAFRFIQKQSMDQRKPLKEIARLILDKKTSGGRP